MPRDSPSSAYWRFGDGRSPSYILTVGGLPVDPNWLVKKDGWSTESAGAIRFLEEVRVLFAIHELVERFPVLLEYHLRSDIRRRVSASGLRSVRGDFHVQTICRYLEQSPEGIFIIERHVPPDLDEDRAILLQALERATAT